MYFADPSRWGNIFPLFQGFKLIHWKFVFVWFNKEMWLLINTGMPNFSHLKCFKPRTSLVWSSLEMSIFLKSGLFSVMLERMTDLKLEWSFVYFNSEAFWRRVLISYTSLIMLPEKIPPHPNTESVHILLPIQLNIAVHKQINQTISSLHSLQFVPVGCFLYKKI